MSTSTITVSDVMEAIAAQLQETLGAVIEGVQVDPKLVLTPTPPCIDIYPGEPFLEPSAFGGPGFSEALFVVRARVAIADQQDGQELLLQILDPNGPLSLVGALNSDRTFGGVVDDSRLDSCSGFIPFDAGGGGGGTLLGCEVRWRVIL